MQPCAARLFLASAMGAAPDFADHFSSQAPAYRRHRPGYPAGLFDYLAGAEPLELIRGPLRAAWGNADAPAVVRRPISLRAGRKPRE